MERRVWSKSQDEELFRLVNSLGMESWSRIARRLQRTFPNISRTGKQCRQRWHNHLNPTIKRDSWTLAEVQKFVDVWSLHKNRWTKISELVQGRTENSLKNFFYSNLRRALKVVNSQLKLRGQQKFQPSFFTNSQQNPNYLVPLIEQAIRALQMLGFTKSFSPVTPSQTDKAVASLLALRSSKFPTLPKQHDIPGSSIREVQSVDLNPEEREDRLDELNQSWVLAEQKASSPEARRLDASQLFKGSLLEASFSFNFL